MVRRSGPRPPPPSAGPPGGGGLRYFTAAPQGRPSWPGLQGLQGPLGLPHPWSLTSRCPPPGLSH